MSVTPGMGRGNLTRTVSLLLAGLAIGYVVGIGAAPSARIRADVTEDAKREAFRSGGVLNEPVLREISATLKRIEAKVERIEKHANAADHAPAAKVKN